MSKRLTREKVINLIFWNDEDLTSEQIVDRALSYKPILL